MHLLGAVSINSLHQKTMNLFFQGKSMKELQLLADHFLNQTFSEMKNEPIIEILNKAKQEGKFVAILSSSPSFLVVAIAKKLNVDDHLATQYQLNHKGEISGLLYSVLGKDKAEYVNNLEFDSQQIAAFSDSIHDLPFLESVGYPIAVNPDRKLKNISKQMGWTIL